MISKITIKSLLLLTLAVLTGSMAKAQLTGTINVPNATYPSLDSVIRTLNIQGVGTGGVVINLLSGNPQNAPMGGYVLGSTTLNASTSATKTVTINGNNNSVLAYTGTGSTDAMFTINGADYVTINGLSLQEDTVNNTTTTKQMEWGFSFVKLNSAAPFDGCQNNVINGCTIKLSIANSVSMGIRLAHTQYNSTTVLGTTGVVAGDANSNNKFTGNTILGCNTAYSSTGINNTSFYDFNNSFGGTTSASGNNVTIGGNSTTNYGIRTTYDTLCSILNNQFSFSAAQTGTSYMIYPGLGKGNLNISNNTFNVSGTATTSSQYVLYNYNVSSAGHQDANATFKFSGNTITGTNTTTTSAYLYGMYNYYSTFLADSIYNNTVTNLTWGASTSTAYLYLFYNYYGNTPYVYVKGNSMTNINKIGGTSGYIYGFYIYNYPATSGAVTFTNNLMQNISTNYYVYGMYVTAGYSGTQTLVHKNNKIDKVVLANSGYLYGHYGYYGASGSEIAFDTISNCRTASGGIYGIYQGLTDGSVHDNLVLNDTSATSTIYGLYHANGTSSIYNNKISGLTLTGASGTLYGMYFSTVTLQTNVYNNSISDYKVPTYSGTGLYGMYLSATANYNVYHNTIKLNCSTTGTNLGTAGIYYSSSLTSLDLRNNIINLDIAPMGTGIVASLVRSSGTAGVVPSNLAATSNGNIYYVPNTTNAYLYAEGYSTSAVNKYNVSLDPNFNTSCGSYKSFMTPRESASFAENNLSPVGTSILYAPTGTSYGKSGAVPTTAPAVTVDINNVTRANPADPGALQFAATANDAAPPIISYNPLNSTTYCLTGPTLTATITDVSGVNTTTNPPRVYYRKTTELDSFGVYPANNVSSFNGWKYATASNSSSPFSFTIDYSKLNSTAAANDTIVYFIVAQDNASTPNVGNNVVGYQAGYCPTSVNLGSGAGPTVGAPAKNRYTILPQPALPTVAPTASTVCLGSFKKLTANPTSGTLTATFGTAALSNSTSGYPTPFGQFYGSSHEQYLIRASELTAQGLTAGPISALAFNQATGYSYAALLNYSISMANTASTAMGSTFISTGFTTVYSNSSYTPPATTGWAPVTFSTPFNWDGVSNVVVDVSFSNCSVCNGTSSCTTSYTNNGSVYQTPTSFVSTLNVHADGNCTINSFTPSISGTTYSQRPDLQLVGTQRFNVNWSPVTALYKDSTLTQPISATDTNTVVYASPSVTTSYAVSNVLGACNSSNSVTPAVVTVSSPTTTTTPAGTASFCGGSSANISGPTGTGYSYQWLLNGANIAGATSQSFTAATTGNYTLKVTSSVTGCSATSAPIVVSNTPAPPATATPAGATTVCSGGTVTMSAPTGAYTYQWTRNGTPLSNATSTGYTATATGNYGVIVSAAANCSTTSSNVPVLVDTVNIATSAASSTAICTGNSVTLNGTTAPNRLYQWQQGGSNISGATNSSYVASAAGNYTLVATNSATGCSATSSPAITVTVGTGPTANFTPSGTVGVCPGSTTTLSIAPVSGLSYQWSLNGTPIAGAISSSYAASAAGNYTLNVSSSPTCQTNSAATTVVLNPLPNTTTTPAGPNATVCQNSTLPISVPTGPGFTYQWKQGGVNIAGATTNTYGATISGNYTVTVTNTATGCASTSSNLSVAVSQLPVVSAISTGPLTICNGDTSVLNAGSGTGTGYTYQWQQNGQNIAGGSSATYKAYLPGSYTVIVTNVSNCSTTSTPIALTVNPTPAAMINYSAPLEFCDGGAVVLSANQGSNLSYQWLLDGNPIPNAVSASDVANLSGNYSVKVTNGLGCSAVSIPEKITVHALPQPSIARNGLTLTTDIYSTYQWYMDGNKMTGAVARSLNVNKDGGYYVEVTDSFGCQNHSAVALVNVANLSVAGLSGNDAGIRIYPNPTQAIINIDAPVKVNVTILDATGRTIISKEHASIIDLGQIASGTYMVIVADENGQVLKTEKVIKSE